MTLPRPLIAGLAGPELRPEERALFLEHPPAGFILFARNCVDRAQLKALTAALKGLFPERWVPVLVDQEGGRVQRMKPPEWAAHPAAAILGHIAADNMMQGMRALPLWARRIAADLAEVGIDVNCAPVLDVASEGMTDAIGDRAFSHDPIICGTLGSMVIEAFAASGVVPVIKHMPGHGRAVQDSHLALPRVDADLDSLRRRDFIPFGACREAPLAMTAHIVFAAVDPDCPATQSHRVIADIIRGEIAYKGLLVSDDLSMKALSGELAERALKALEAGCDLALHCTGDIAEMGTLLAALPALDEARAAKLEAVRPKAAAAPDIAALDAAWRDMFESEG